MSKKKSPKNIKHPTFKKTPRIKEEPIDYESKTVVWHISKIDRNGNWGWENINKKIFWNYIFKKIKSLESMTWSEIKKNKKSHSILFSEISTAAQNRLVEIEQDDVAELFSLRLGSKKRIWGIRNGRVLEILWWDPNHTVCPSFKKYT